MESLLLKLLMLRLHTKELEWMPIPSLKTFLYQMLLETSLLRSWITILLRDQLLTTLWIMNLSTMVALSPDSCLLQLSPALLPPLTSDSSYLRTKIMPWPRLVVSLVHSLWWRPNLWIRQTPLATPRETSLLELIDLAQSNKIQAKGSIQALINLKPKFGSRNGLITPLSMVLVTTCPMKWQVCSSMIQLRLS